MGLVSTGVNAMFKEMTIEDARDLLDSMSAEDLPKLDEWFRVGDYDVNVTGCGYSARAPENGVCVCVYVATDDRYGEPVYTYTLYKDTLSETL